MKIHLKRTFCAGALVAGLAAGAADLKMPSLVSGPGLIDGILSEECWQKAYQTGSFTAVRTKDGTIREPAEAFVFATDTAIYIGVKNTVTDKARLEKDIAKSKTWIDMDTVEIFLDPGDTGNYAHFAVNAAGIAMRPKNAQNIRYGVQVNDNDWTLELEIPFEDIPVATDKVSSRWRMNIGRGNYSISESSSWAKLEGDFHDVAHFQVVTGIKADLKRLYAQQQLAKKKDFTVETDRIIACGRDTLGVKVELNAKTDMKGWYIKARVTGSADLGGRGATALPGDGRARTPSAPLVVKPVFFTTEFTIPIKDLADGRYTLDISVCDATNAVRHSDTKVFYVAPPAKPLKRTVTIENGNFLIDGKFFFPVGTHACGAYIPKKDATREEHIAANEAWFKEAVEHGLNCVAVTDWNFPEEDYDEIRKLGGLEPWLIDGFKSAKQAGMTFHDYCTIAEKYNIKVVARSSYLHKWSPKNIDCFVQQLLRIRDEENNIIWYTADETDGGVEGNLRRNRLYHEIAPYRPTWLTLINAIVPNQEAADILATDPYPVPGGKLLAVATHADRLEKLFADRPNRTQFLWLQDFGGECGWTRPPTPEERRVMTFLAFTHGARGLFYFNWWKPERRDGVRQHKEAWNTMGALGAEIQKYAPITCLGKRLATKRIGFVDVSVFEYEGKKTAFVINTDKDPVKGVKVDFPGVFAETVDLDGFEVVVRK